MSAPFAAFESATAQGVVAALANVSATHKGAAVDGIFDTAYGEAFGLVAGSDPVFRCLASVGVARGDSLIINSVTYTVTGVESDGTGLVMCRLDAA